MRKSAELHDESIFPLPDWLAARLLATGGRLPWRQVMELALYERRHGYYSRVDRAIGRQGDFFTSVSVGPLFGWLLALQAVEVWCKLGCPERFTIAEQGAHDGQAALDLYAGLQALAPDLAARVVYAVVEPREPWRAALVDRLKPVLGRRLCVVRAWDELCAPDGRAWPGMAWSNELLDAFPVDRLVWESVRDDGDGPGRAGAWRRMGVECVAAEEGDGHMARWCPMETAEDGAAPPPPGVPWETEFCPGIRSWTQEVAGSGLEGLWLTIDYGGLDSERWIPERAAGSLRRFTGHRTDDRLLEDLGQCDLTADVNFSELMAAQAEWGWVPVGYADQGRYLTRLATPWLRELERAVAAGRGAEFAQPKGSWQRQLATLTHPGWMGRRFKVQACVSAGVSREGWRGFGG